MLAQALKGALEGAAMEDLTRTRLEPGRTQPIGTVRPVPRESLPRSTRLVRTVVFGLALIVGTATLVVLSTRDEVALRNPSRLYSPSGHLPGEPSNERNVSMSWTSVVGAAGYWWSVVEDASDLAEPVIRPSGNDRRVFFPFSGRGYFALRTAFRIDGDLRWSRVLLYGPIVVHDDALPDPPVPSASPSVEGGGAAAVSRQGAGGRGGFGGSAPAVEPPAEPVDPRYAGQPGGEGTGSGQRGGPGQPGQPPQQPGSGHTGPPNDDGTPGSQGSDGAPGPD